MLLFSKNLFLFKINSKILKCVTPSLSKVNRNCLFHSSQGSCNSETKEDTGDDSWIRNNSADDIKAKILEESLAHVCQNGWTKETLATGAKQLGYPGIAHGMFSDGGPELVHYFYSSRNRLLENYLQKNKDKKLKVNALIRDAVEVRLRMILPYIETWPQAMAIITLPSHAPTALKNLGDLVNTIWHYAGDKSVDTNWYTKRLILAAVYKSTELCMIQDKSPDYMETWNFLDRRMQNVAQFGKCTYQVKEMTSLSSDILQGGFITVRNMLGLNWFARRPHVN